MVIKNWISTIIESGMGWCFIKRAGEVLAMIFQIFLGLNVFHYCVMQQNGVKVSFIPFFQELEILNELLGLRHPTTLRSREDVKIILQWLDRKEEAKLYE